MPSLVLSACCGLSFLNTFFTIMAEVCGADLVFIVMLAFLLGNSVVFYIAPYILTSTENYGHWCIGNAVICLSFTIFGYFYMIETQGLEKMDIYDL